MSKNLKNTDLSKFSDESNFEQLKKRSKKVSKKSKTKRNHRDDYVNPDDIDW